MNKLMNELMNEPGITGRAHPPLKKFYVEIATWRKKL